MPKRRVALCPGRVYHVFNRAVWRAQLFHQDGDYAVLRSLLRTTQQRIPVKLFAYCIMPNHFHLVCEPSEDGQLSDFMRLLTMVHSKRWHAARGTTGTGPVYQGRFKAFAVQADSHFLRLCRYVERNALRGGLVKRAQDWQWGSLGERWRKSNHVALETWPIPQPRDWIAMVNGGESDVHEIRMSIARSRPFGSPAWIRKQKRRK